MHDGPGQHGVVVGLGSAAAAAARLYATLTDRPYRHATDVGALARVRARIEVLVTTYPHLTYPLLEQLFGEPHPAGLAPGLLVASSAAALRSRARQRAAGLTSGSASNGGIVEVRAVEQVGRVQFPDRVLYGARTPGPTLRRALAAGADLLAITSYSDGLDASLGDLVLCALAGDARRPPVAPTPLCLRAATCYRLDLPIDQALGSGRLVDPDEVSARVLLFLGCWGLLASGGLTDPRWGFMDRLVGSPRIGAIITGWEVLFLTPGDVDMLVRLLANGSSLGEAVERFNGSRAAADTGNRLCLLGDPRLRLSRRAADGRD